jgi:hypothetical protein
MILKDENLNEINVNKIIKRFSDNNFYNEKDKQI